MNVCYFVHDLGDAAVWRRVRMLQVGGATVTLVGFRRAGAVYEVLAGVAIIELGRTEPARLIRRAMAVLRAAMRLGQVRGAVLRADIIIARQLETLMLAVAARSRFTAATPIVFECLDIHRMMCGRSPQAAVMRWLEGWLLRRCAMLIVSSPAFVRHHFSRYHELPRICLIENKVVGVGEAPVAVRRRHGGPQPWRIGWFGVLRCRRSLMLLAELVRTQQGRVEVILRGNPAFTSIPDFHQLTRGVPGLSYGGRYDGSTDLAGLYSAVDFTWAIDFFEAGANSAWLLPNRLYEGGLHGSIPLAMRATETGRWLAARGAGVLFEEPLADRLSELFAGLTEASLVALRTELPLDDLVHDRAACERLVADLRSISQADLRSVLSRPAVHL